MSVVRRITLGLILSLFFTLNLQAATRLRPALVRVPVSTQDELRSLQAQGLDIVYLEPGQFVEILVSDQELERITKASFHYQMIHQDYVAFQQSGLSGQLDMGGYHTMDELYVVLDSIHNDHPAITTARDSIGYTIEGRVIYAIKISDNPESDEDEPEVFFNALTHAREPIGMEALLYFMHYLTDNYGTDARVDSLVNNRELWFIPLVNPDGYEYNSFIEPSGGGMWRKNRRDNGDGSFGIDLNRNFGYQWGYDDVGSTPYTWDETYRGTGPFSEPEVASIRDFVLAHDFVVAVNYHSYGDLLIYPWGYIAFDTPDRPLFENLGAYFTAVNHYTYGSSNNVSYTTNGGVYDWMYGEQISKKKIIAFLPEVGGWNDGGFWPPEYLIDGLCLENLEANLRLAERAGTLYNHSCRFTRTEPDFLDTTVIYGGTLSLPLRLVNQDLTSTLSFTALARDSAYYPFSGWAENDASGQPKSFSFDKFQSVSSLASVKLVPDWLDVTPSGLTVIPAGESLALTVNVNSSALDLGSTYKGEIVIASYNDRMGGIQDTAVIPVKIKVGFGNVSPQSVILSTAKVQNRVANTGNFAKAGPGMRYSAYGENFIFDGSLFLAYIRANGDTVVHRHAYSTNTIQPLSYVVTSTSDPRFYTAEAYWAGQYNDLGVDAKVLAPQHPDSSELMIFEYKIYNRTSSTIANIYAGMFADFDILPNYTENDGGVDPSLNLAYVYYPDQIRAGGIMYLSEQKPYGGIVLNNVTHVWPTADFKTGDLYRLASTPGLDVEAAFTDLNTLLTAKRFNLAAGETTQIKMALVTSRSGLDSLKANAVKAATLAGECLLKTGDANADGKLTLIDIIAMVNYIFYKPGCSPQPQCWLSGELCRGDWNGNGQVSLSDVLTGVNYLFNKPGGPWNPKASGICCALSN
jgi:hypothetical protein